MGRLVWFGLLVVIVSGSAAVWGQGAPVRVSGGTMAGQLVERTDPQYPPLARAAGVSGAVTLRAIIDETGHVASLQVVGGPEMLRSAALEAVRRWVYTPFLLNGVATSVDTVVTVNFQAAGGPTPPPSAKSADDGAKSTEPTSSQVADFCGTPKISHQVMQSYLVKRVDATYPKLTEASGLVVLRVCLTKEGTVEKEQFVSGPEPLRGAAMDAVMQWVFRPYLINGVHTAVSTTVTVAFFQR